MPIRSARNSGLARQAYCTMLERIVRGDYAVGQVISRRKIAGDLGISFVPVSEALQRLEWEGLLESRPRSGTRVRIPTREDMQGHFTMREALEVQAAMLFAENATSGERRELIDLAALLDRQAREQNANSHGYRALHENLHLKIAECAGCALLSEAIWKQSALASTWFGAVKTIIPQGARARHEPLMKALARETPAAAADTMRAHLRMEMEHALRNASSYPRPDGKYSEACSRASQRGSGQPAYPA